MKLRLSILIVLLPGLFFFSNCEKKRIFDYRNKYVGDYKVEYSYVSWQMNQPYTTKDTFYLTANLSYEKNGPRDEVMLKFGNQLMKLKVDNNRKITLCNHEIGKFDDGDHFMLSYSSYTCGSGALGGGANFKLIGEK